MVYLKFVFIYIIINEYVTMENGVDFFGFDFKWFKWFK